MGSTADSSRISPTALYTGEVWGRHGLSHPRFSTAGGRVMYRAMWPAQAVYEQYTGRPGLESMLLARHRIIDYLLQDAIEQGQVHQVLEVASGLSPRGWRFMRSYPKLRYVEADLPDMAARKQQLLNELGASQHHRVAVIDALADQGECSLSELVHRELRPGLGTALITEGLINYFPLAEVIAMFGRFARCLRQQGGGVYLSDINLSVDARGVRSVQLFRHLLQLATRGRVHLHFQSVGACVEALLGAGFDRSELHHPASLTDQLAIPGPDVRRHMVRVLRAVVDPG